MNDNRNKRGKTNLQIQFHVCGKWVDCTTQPALIQRSFYRGCWYNSTQYMVNEKCYFRNGYRTRFAAMPYCSFPVSKGILNHRYSLTGEIKKDMSHDTQFNHIRVYNASETK